MTQSSGFGPPGVSSVAVPPAVHGNFVRDPKVLGKYRCVKHDLRLNASGSVLVCLEGCRIHPPSA